MLQQIVVIVHQMLLETMLFHHNLQPYIHQLIFLFMFNSQLQQLLDIQLEVRKIGKHGPEIWKTLEICKLLLLTQEFHMHLLSNLMLKLKVMKQVKMDHQMLLETQHFLHNQQLLHQQHKFLLMFNSLQPPIPDIQLEERKIGKLGLEIWKILEINKLMLPILEFHMLLLFNLNQQLKLWE